MTLLTVGAGQAAPVLPTLSGQYTGIVCSAVTETHLHADAASAGVQDRLDLAESARFPRGLNCTASRADSAVAADVAQEELLGACDVGARRWGDSDDLEGFRAGDSAVCVAAAGASLQAAAEMAEDEQEEASDRAAGWSRITSRRVPSAAGLQHLCATLTGDTGRPVLSEYNLLEASIPVGWAGTAAPF